MVLLSFCLGAWGILSLHDNWPKLAFVWLLCLALALSGSAVIGRLGSTPAIPGAEPTRPIHLVLLVACVALGLFFRLHRLYSVPPGVFVDETNGALDALRILQGSRTSPFGLGWFETPSLYAYYMAGIFEIGGLHFWTLKCASLLPAILTILALIPLAGFLFGPRVAVLAAFLLAASRWHVTLSRWGWNELMPPLFQIVSTWLLLRALISRRAVEFVAAGIVLGLCMYTYLASRMVVGVTTAYLLYRIVFESGFFRRHSLGLLLFVLGYLLCFGPLAVTYVRNPAGFLGRSHQVSILRDVERQGSWSPLFENAIRHVRMFRGRGDPNGRHNLPGEPMLSFPAGMLFLGGVVLALWRIRDHRFGLLLLWVVVTLQGGIFSTLDEGPQSYRTLGALPAICMLSAVAADEGLRLLGRRVLLGRLGFILLIAALGYDAYWSHHVYFGAQARADSVWQGFNPIENSIGRRLMEERHKSGSLSHVYLAHRFFYFSQVRFFLYRPREGEHGGLDDPEFHLFVPQRDLPVSIEAPRDLLLLLPTNDAAGAELVRHYYPHARIRTIFERAAGLYAEVVVPWTDVLALQGLTTLSADGTPLAETDGGSSLDERLSRLEPDQALVGAILLSRSGLYCVGAAGPIVLEIDGRRLPGAVRPIAFGQGLHDLHVRRIAGGGELSLSIRGAGASGKSGEPVRLYRTSAPRRGLRGRYFATRNWSRPLFDQIDPVLSFHWPEEEPMRGAFSVSWEGQLRVEQAGVYEFEMECDDGCAMTLDGQVVASALEDGTHVVQGRRELAGGDHEIRIDYFQSGGAKQFEMRWRRPNRTMEVIPSSALLPAELEPPRTGEGTCGGP